MKTTITRISFGLLAAAPPLAIYLMTMAPGLIARGDTPKFQYLGAILGTSHSPGYPLYVLLSSLFSQLPIGDVAWRVNFMTAFFGAMAAVAMFAACRELGANRGAALFSAWGLAFGPVFWSQAMSAEVYTLAAVLQLGVMAFVFRWQRTRRDRDLLSAVAVASLALGHHATIFMIAPSLALFVLLVDWRVILRPKIVLSTIGLVLLGIGQYGYVVYKSFAGAPYVEAHARTPKEFFELLSGRQYEREYFGFTVDELLSQRSRLTWELVMQELTIAGVVLMAIGALWLLRRNWRVLVLLIAIISPLVVFVMTYRVGDTPVFMIPVFLPLWVAASVGLSVTTRVLARARSWDTVASLAAAVILACVFVPRSFAAEDLSKDTFDRRFVSALLDQIDTPARIYFSADDAMSHAVRYGLFIDNIAHGPVSIGRILRTQDPRPEWRNVPGAYLLGPTRRLMEARGVLVTPVQLRSPDRDWLDPMRVPVFRVVADAPCREAATDNWVVFDREMMIGPRFTAWAHGDRSTPRRDDGLQLIVLAGSDRAAPAVGGFMPDGDDLQPSLEQFDLNDPAVRQSVLAQFGQAGLAQPPTTRFVTRATIPLAVTEAGHVNAVIGTGPEPTWFAVKMKSRRAVNVRYCGSPTEGIVLFGDRSVSSVELMRMSGFVIWGWNDLESAGDERYRWTSLARAELQFNLLESLPLTLTIDAAPAQTGRGARINVELNGQPLESRPMTDQMQSYEWTVPASAFRAGVNEVVVIGPEPVAGQSLRVRRVELARAPQGAR